MFKKLFQCLMLLVVPLILSSCFKIGTEYHLNYSAQDVSLETLRETIDVMKNEKNYTITTKFLQYKNEVNRDKGIFTSIDDVTVTRVNDCIVYQEDHKPFFSVEKIVLYKYDGVVFKHARNPNTKEWITTLHDTTAYGFDILISDLGRMTVDERDGNIYGTTHFFERGFTREEFSVELDTLDNLILKGEFIPGYIDLVIISTGDNVDDSDIPDFHKEWDLFILQLPLSGMVKEELAIYVNLNWSVEWEISDEEIVEIIRKDKNRLIIKPLYMSTITVTARLIDSPSIFKEVVLEIK